MEFEELEVTTRKREELVNITKDIEDLLKRKNINDGLCNIYIPHTTAGILINEGADAAVAEDISNYLKKLIPQKEKIYSHLEGNADSHIKAAIIGQSKIIPIKDGNLLLGMWQGIFFCEFDGPRKRKVLVSIIS